MILGLDVGRQVIKTVTVEKQRSGGYKLLHVAQRLIPEQHKAYDPEAVSRPIVVMAIKEILKQQKINPKRVRNLVSNINGTNVSVRQIMTMDMATEELQSALTFEARKHIPMDGTDAVIDFQIFGQNPNEVDKIDVGMVACTKSVLNGHLDLLKESGFKPGIVDTDPIALSNAFVLHHDFPEEGVIVLLDIGAVSSSLVVWGQKDQFFTRDIPVGGHLFVKGLSDVRKMDYITAQDELYKDGVNAFQETNGTQEIGLAETQRTVFDNLVEDVRRSLRYYAKTTNQSFFQKIYLTGGCAGTPGLCDFIQSNLNIDVEIFNPFATLDGTDGLDISNPGQYGVAVGLAIRGGVEA